MKTKIWKYKIYLKGVENRCYNVDFATGMTIAALRLKNSKGSVELGDISKGGKLVDVESIREVIAEPAAMKDYDLKGWGTGELIQEERELTERELKAYDILERSRNKINPLLLRNGTQ
jgi:hypothetical protein